MITGGPGTIGILNVGVGDTKLTFDKNNPADCIRAARIVKDMLRRGYALLVETEVDGVKKFVRVHDFKDDTYEYVIADFDPMVAQAADDAEERTTDAASTEPSRTPPDGSTEPQKRRGRPTTKTLSAHTGRGVAIARTAGG